MAEHYQAPVLAVEVEARLAKAGTGAIPVIVTFVSPVTSGDLEALGLYGSSAEPSEIAYGSLTPDRVRALAARAGVKSISLAALLPAPPTGPEKKTSMDKIQVHLLTMLTASPKDKRVVIVYFRKAVSEDTLKALGLSRLVDDAGSGRLDKAEVLRTAERPDVRRIEAMPEMKKFR